MDRGWQKDNGLLPTDRPHVISAHAVRMSSIGRGSKKQLTELNVFQTFQSGTLVSSTITHIVPLFLNGRGDRPHRCLYQTDFFGDAYFKFGRDSKLRALSTPISTFSTCSK